MTKREIMYNEGIYQKFLEINRKHELIKDHDIIAVEVSADKTAIALLAYLQYYRKMNQKQFDIVYFAVIEQGEEKELQEVLDRFEIPSCNIQYKTEQTDIFATVKEAGCNKIALSQNYSDIVNMTFMTLMQNRTMTKLHPERESTKESGIRFIRPFCIVEEAEVVQFIEQNGLNVRERITAFGELTLMEEGLCFYGYDAVPKYKVNVYECF